jgi:Trk-type K+ transport system membrane component
LKNVLTLIILANISFVSGYVYIYWKKKKNEKKIEQEYNHCKAVVLLDFFSQEMFILLHEFSVTHNTSNTRFCSY